jgi:hypothetical protein
MLTIMRRKASVMSRHLHHGISCLLTLLGVDLLLTMLILSVLSARGWFVTGQGWFALTLAVLVLGIAGGAAWFSWRHDCEA